MYLRQMGQVPLLTREQEVEISKRIEAAENEIKRIVCNFGFAGKEHIALAEKLICRAAQRAVRPCHSRPENRQPRSAP